MDPTAEMFLRFVQPHYQRLHRVSRQYVMSEEDARDLVQETLLRAWGVFQPTEEKTYRRAWLFKIMRHIACDWWRLQQRRVRLTHVPDEELTQLAPSDLGEPYCPLPNMDEQQFRQFLDDQVAAALDRLHDAHREVLIFSVVGELNYREIAGVLECPMGTVMSRMARARRALREELADYARSRGIGTGGRR